MRSVSRSGSCGISISAGLSLCESSIILDWIISLHRVGGRNINKSRWPARGTDEFPSVVFVTPALYCKTEMILFPWQLCVNVLRAVFLHFMPSACSVYHCLLNDWSYCTVSLLSIGCLGRGSWWSPVRQKCVGVSLLHRAAGIRGQTVIADCLWWWGWSQHFLYLCVRAGLSAYNSFFSSVLSCRFQTMSTSKHKHPHQHSSRRVFVCAVWVWDWLYKWIYV